VLAGPVLDLQWSEDSKRIVVVGEGKEKFGSVFLWDSGSSVGEISGHSKAISTVDFKQTRPYRIATGSEDCQVNYFEGPPFKYKKSFKEHTRFVTCVRFSPNGEKLVSVATDKSAFLFDGKTGDQIGKLNPDQNHSAGIYSVSWSPDSTQLFTASADKTCKLWDAASGNCLKTFTVKENAQVEDQQLGTLWQGKTVLSVSLSGDINYWDLESTSHPSKVVRGHSKFITALAFDEKNGKLYSGSYDSLIVEWDVKTGTTEGFKGKGHGNQVNRAYVQNGQLVTCSMDDTLRFTPLASREYNANSVTFDSNPVDVAVSKKSDLVVAVNLNSVVVIKGGKQVSKLSTKYEPTSVALNVDNTQVAVGAKDNKIYVLNVNGDSLSDAFVLEGHRGPLTSLEYSPDGKYLASGDYQRDIFVWNLATKSIQIQGWVFHTAKVNSIAWSPDSLHIVSGSLDGNLFVWSVEDPSKRIQVKDAHRGGVNVVLWLDNNTAASAGQDATVKTWSVKHH
jgi:WD40 repeat protein